VTPKTPKIGADSILEALAAARAPLTPADLAERLALQTDEARSAFNAQVEELERSGRVVRNRAGLLLVAARANLLSAFIPARRRIGYDKSRSKDLHGLFINERIPDRPGIHVLDALGSFCEPLGLHQTEVRWNLPVPADAFEWAKAQWPEDGRRTLMISPCSSHVLRNWHAERYAAVADHAITRGWRVVLCGGRSELERQTSDAILAAMQGTALDLVGKDTLKQLPALLQRADLLMTPDSGPMHIANAMGTKVLGLHAASNPERSGPYTTRRYCVDRYDDAARKFRGKPAAELKWGTKIEHEGVMDLITVEDAIAAFDRYETDRAG
jgi:heptosyltransferase I